MSDDLIRRTIETLNDNSDHNNIKVIPDVLTGDKLHLHILCTACSFGGNNTTLIVGIPVNSDNTIKENIKETCHLLEWYVQDNELYCQDCANAMDSIEKI